MKSSARRVFTLFPLLILVSLFAFACSTAYQSAAQDGVGYSDREVAPNVYEVAYTTDGPLALEEVEQLMLYRAAELALSQGYSHFTLLERGEQKSFVPLVRHGGAQAAPADARTPAYAIRVGSPAHISTPGTPRGGVTTITTPSGTTNVGPQNEIAIATEYKAGGAPKNPSRRLLHTVSGRVELLREPATNAMNARDVLRDLAPVAQKRIVL